MTNVEFYRECIEELLRNKWTPQHEIRRQTAISSLMDGNNHDAATVLIDSAIESVAEITTKILTKHGMLTDDGQIDLDLRISTIYETSKRLYEEGIIQRDS